MALITLAGAQLAFGHVPLLDRADLSLEPGERIGLIGRNGTGKSSLMKVLAGVQSLDDGERVAQSGLRVAWVPQEPDFGIDETLAQVVAGAFPAVLRDLQRYHDVSHALAQASTPALLTELEQLQHRLEANNAWGIERRVQQVLDRLGLQSNTRVAELSGGQRKRLALARGLVSEPDLLLLDEPTNHLDFEAIAWLEDLLRDFAGAVVCITHDRRFLDAVATRIVELDRGHLASFPGNYAAYCVRKAEQLEAEALEQARFDKLLAQEEVWIRKGVEARRTRSVHRVQRLEQLRLQRAERRERMGDVRLAVAEGQRSGKLVAELVDVRKAWGGQVVVDGFSTVVMRGDRVGLIGPNGAGKTTLLRLILGLTPADAGTVRRGTRLEIAYFDQMREQLDPALPIADVISPGSEWIEIGGERRHVMSYLGDFLFAPERARSPVSSLSGGERARLLLARLFARPANVLVLDEPTNDLDIETLELLEQLLQDYSGTVFLVSHDREFLDNVVTQTIAWQSPGRWREYPGGYADVARQGGLWMAQAATASGPDKRMGADAVTAAKAPDKPVEKAADKKPRGSQRLSNWEEKELAGLPDRIAALEAEQASLQAALADGRLFRDEPAKAQASLQRIEALEGELMTALERWEALEARRAQAGV